MIGTREKELSYLIDLSSEIRMIISHNGTQNILNNSFYLEHSEVIVNGITRESCKKFCYLEFNENNITFIL